MASPPQDPVPPSVVASQGETHTRFEKGSRVFAADAARRRRPRSAALELPAPAVEERGTLDRPEEWIIEPVRAFSRAPQLPPPGAGRRENWEVPVVGALFDWS